MCRFQSRQQSHLTDEVISKHELLPALRLSVSHSYLSLCLNDCVLLCLQSSRPDFFASSSHMQFDLRVCLWLLLSVKYMAEKRPKAQLLHGPLLCPKKFNLLYITINKGFYFYFRERERQRPSPWWQCRCPPQIPIQAKCRCSWGWWEVTEARTLCCGHTHNFTHEKDRLTEKTVFVQNRSIICRYVCGPCRTVCVCVYSRCPQSPVSFLSLGGQNSTMEHEGERERGTLLWRTEVCVSCSLIVDLSSHFNTTAFEYPSAWK